MQVGLLGLSESMSSLPHLFITDPTFPDDMFGNGVGIHLLSRMAVPQDAMAILDPCMLPEETREEEEKEERIEEMVIMSEEDGTERVPRWMEECVVSMLRIGISCSCIAPRWMEECVISATKIGLSCSSPVP